MMTMITMLMTMKITKMIIKIAITMINVNRQQQYLQSTLQQPKVGFSILSNPGCESAGMCTVHTFKMMILKAEG